jgi:hypothetical protein
LPRHNRRFGRFGWFVPIICLFTSLSAFIFIAREMNFHSTETVSEQRLEQETKLTCSLVQGEWYGDPIYALENESDESLQHISILSWSEQVLPILWVGRKGDAKPKHIQSPVLPPVNLPAHQMIWFAGPRSETTASPKHFTIDWLRNGHGQSEIVEVQS